MFTSLHNIECLINHLGIPSNPLPYDVSGTSQTSSHYFTYQYHLYGPTLSICSAIGCSETVKNDERFGAFEYCSPKCRDEHLLPDYNKKLQEDINRFHAECKVSHSHTTCTSTLPITSSSNIRTVTFETKPKEDIGFLLAYNKELKKVISQLILHALCCYILLCILLYLVWVLK